METIDEAVFEKETWIDAHRKMVWEYFTDPGKLMEWHGSEAAFGDARIPMAPSSTVSSSR